MVDAVLAKRKEAPAASFLASVTTSLYRVDKVHCPKQLAAAFASSVTKQSFRERDWIARKGRSSLFGAFHCILPQVRSAFNLSYMM
jgi:hypothetical protein